MSKPAVLARGRSILRCVATGFFGFVGLLLVALGVIGMFDGAGGVGLAGAVVVTGAVVTVLAEVFARRFWVLDTATFRWERSFGSEELPWGQAAFGTELLAAPGWPGPESDDRMIVVGPDRRPRPWGRRIKHHQAATTVREWERMRGAYAYGRFDIGSDTKPFHLLVDGPELHTMRVRARVVGQAVIAVVTLVTGLWYTAQGLAGPLTRQVAFAMLAVPLFAWFVVALRNLTSSVKVLPDGLLHRRWGVRRQIGWHEIAGVNVVQRPKAVSLVPLGIGFLLIGLFGSASLGGNDVEDIFAVKSHPQLILRDGTGIELSGLSTRSASKADRFAYALSVARRVGKDPQSAW